MFPLEFPGEVKRQKTRVMGLLCGEGRTDRQTDGRTGDSMLSRAKNGSERFYYQFNPKIGLYEINSVVRTRVRYTE